MKQKISKQMDGGLNTQRFAEDLVLLMAVQVTLRNYEQGIVLGTLLEMEEN